MDVKDLSDEKRAEIKERQRHKELLDGLKAIANKQAEPEKDDGMLQAIEKQAETIVRGFNEAVSKIPKPDIKINQSYEQVVSSINTMKSEVLTKLDQLISAIEDRPVVDEFKLEKDNLGYTKAVKVNYKKSKDITIKAKQYGVN